MGLGVIFGPTSKAAHAVVVDVPGGPTVAL